MSGIGNIVSGIAGLAGGGPGGGQSFFQPVPPQAGGITSDQGDFAQYGYQQNLLANASQFATSGTGESTMATQAAGGSRIGKAETEGQISDTDATAFLNATRIGQGASATQNQAFQTGLNSLSSSLGSLAKAGFAASGNANPTS